MTALNSRSIGTFFTCLIVILSLTSLFNMTSSVGIMAVSPDQVLTTYTPPCPGGAVCARLATKLTVTTPEIWIPPSQTFVLSGKLTVDGTDNGIPREPVNVLVFGYITSTKTDASGEYTLSLTTPSQEGDYELTASFPGDNQWAPAQASLSISVSSHIPSPPPPPTPVWPFVAGFLVVVVVAIVGIALMVRREHAVSSSKTNR